MADFETDAKLNTVMTYYETLQIFAYINVYLYLCGTTML